MEDFLLAYQILCDIYKGNAYSNLQISKHLPNAKNPQLLTKLVYGTLENDVRYDYYISILTQKKPQSGAAVLLKLAIYCLSDEISMPNYAVVNNAVEVIKLSGKKGDISFINAVLQKFIKTEFVLPRDKTEKLSVLYSKPAWYVRAVMKQYKAQTEEILAVKAYQLEHIRPNTRKITSKKLAEMLRGCDAIASDVGGFFVRYNETVSSLCGLGFATIQSVGSIICAKALGVVDGAEVLDMCASPGGKAVLIAENFRGAKVVACDIHRHRTELIQKYAARMGSDNLETVVADGTVQNSDFVGKFDFVLCDAPCSGLGVADKKPDIFINSSLEKCQALAQVQYKLLSNACDYAKTGGSIVYSTCTILREENYNVVGKLLNERTDIELQIIEGIGIENKGWVQLLPNGKGGEGYFIAKLKKR